MQRLEWHCHTKEFQEHCTQLQFLYRGQSAGEEMANSGLFNLRRNSGSDWSSLTEVGREFQAGSPMVVRCVGGTTSVDVEADRRRRRLCTSAVDWSVSARYGGAVPWRQRCIRKHKHCRTLPTDLVASVLRVAGVQNQQDVSQDP